MFAIATTGRGDVARITISIQTAIEGMNRSKHPNKGIAAVRPNVSHPVQTPRAVQLLFQGASASEAQRGRAQAAAETQLFTTAVGFLPRHA